MSWIDEDFEVEETLYDMLSKEYNQLIFNKKLLSFPFEDVLSDEGKCKLVMSVVLKDSRLFNQDADKYQVAKTRARHSLIVYLLGMLLLDAFKFHGKTATKTLGELWILTALYHDIGYFSKYLSQPNADYQEIFTYQLFDDLNSKDPHYRSADFQAYSVDEILAYEQYSIQFHNNNPDDLERVDHGILGGRITYDKLCKKSKQADKATFKKVSVSIAQHSIYKSGSYEDDEKYPDILRNKLSYDSPFRIRQDTQLLFLLNLVDTIECVKKFSKKVMASSAPQEKKQSPLQMNTVLKNIKLGVNGTVLLMDLSNLHKRAQRNGIEKQYKEYVKSLIELNQWMSVSTFVKADLVQIKMDEKEM